MQRHSSSFLGGNQKIRAFSSVIRFAVGVMLNDIRGALIEVYERSEPISATPRASS